MIHVDTREVNTRYFRDAIVVREVERTKPERYYVTINFTGEITVTISSESIFHRLPTWFIG